MTSILEMIGIGLIPGFILLDLLYRHRRYDATRFWRLRALAVTAFTFFLATAVALFWGALLADYSLFDASGLGIVGGAALGAGTLGAWPSALCSARFFAINSWSQSGQNSCSPAM